MANSLDPVANSSVHNRLDDVIDRLRDLDRRLSAITTQVCGSAPEQGENARPLEDHIQDKLNAASGYLSDLEHEIARLDIAVGSSTPRKLGPPATTR
jgi:hypothetical protein